MDNKTKSILNVCGLAASSNQDVLLLVDGKFITGTLVLKTETDDIVNQVINWADNELDENSDSSFITLKNISSVGIYLSNDCVFKFNFGNFFGCSR